LMQVLWVHAGVSRNLPSINQNLFNNHPWLPMT
jgi:hypothetical protein